RLQRARGRRGYGTPADGDAVAVHVYGVGKLGCRTVGSEALRGRQHRFVVAQHLRRNGVRHAERSARNRTNIIIIDLLACGCLVPVLPSATADATGIGGCSVIVHTSTRHVARADAHTRRQINSPRSYRVHKGTVGPLRARSSINAAAIKVTLGGGQTY